MYYHKSAMLVIFFYILNITFLFMIMTKDEVVEKLFIGFPI